MRRTTRIATISVLLLLLLSGTAAATDHGETGLLELFFEFVEIDLEGFFDALYGGEE
ncbi:MAG: hypothetical protein PPP58_08960 [Natronomonas sp.]